MIKNTIIAVVLNMFVPFCLGIAVKHVALYFHWSYGTVAMLAVFVAVACAITAIPFWHKALGLKA